ncbi:hypothetical protein OH77DRAFT_1297206 [Trametes cingulata]|nr:hypothetical protein OH77DRAFT_1297206 [Trametes cingulata]
MLPAHGATGCTMPSQLYAAKQTRLLAPRRDGQWVGGTDKPPVVPGTRNVTVAASSSSTRKYDMVCEFTCCWSARFPTHEYDCAQTYQSSREHALLKTHLPSGTPTRGSGLPQRARRRPVYAQRTLSVFQLVSCGDRDGRSVSRVPPMRGARPHSTRPGG